ncbi:MAG: hypothetical protein OXI96_00445 [Acidimicrobiaceae bacterium]|nr:hypothetical protein [Acidimicrobiaceae bacterium]
MSPPVRECGLENNPQGRARGRYDCKTAPERVSVSDLIRMLIAS